MSPEWVEIHMTHNVTECQKHQFELTCEKKVDEDLGSEVNHGRKVVR